MLAWVVLVLGVGVAVEDEGAGVVRHVDDLLVTGPQVLVDPDNVAAAQAFGPVYSETRFGQTVMIFDGVDRDELEPLGQVSTPTLSDLFVALMQRETANPGAR